MADLSQSAAAAAAAAATAAAHAYTFAQGATGHVDNISFAYAQVLSAQYSAHEASLAAYSAADAMAQSNAFNLTTFTHLKDAIKSAAEAYAYVEDAANVVAAAGGGDEDAAGDNIHAISTPNSSIPSHKYPTLRL